ncbi:MAG: CxxxxCH/CxxCH domain-containing protein [Deltaproteobacteria bacterium]|nr:MAG: CxxxxCH/CxxCH domain-containing protein [Deltaproteobacteria bacterium]
MSRFATKRAGRNWRKLVPALLATVLLAAPALADVVTLRPSGVTSTGSWAGVTAANLNDQADGTFASITNALSTYRVQLGNDAAYAGATINSVTVYVRAQVAGGAGAGERLDFGPAGALSGAPVTVSRVAMTNYSYAPATAFTPATVDSLEIDVATTALAAGETMRTADVWAVVDYTPPAGNNTINSCDGCHLQPPAEGAARSGATGAVVGSHAAHSVYACTVCHPNNAVLNHRGGGTPNGTEGKIEMLANIQGGTYSKGAGFNQTNDLTGVGLGTCSNVSCHGGVLTPKWGSGTSLACNSCHGAPPATNAHPEHYAAKGWGATDTAGVHCVECHPDNTAGHSNVTDNSVIVNAGLSPGGVSPAISCGTAPVLGCHNGKTTPQWNTATPIACTNCHTPGGANTADPQTGLHNITVAGVQKHDSTLSDGNGTNGSGCTECHFTKPATHTDGVFNANSNSNTDRFLTRTGMTFADAAVNTSTCSGTLTGCHSDGGVWSRQWSTAANSTATTVGDPRCDVCHGQYGSWRAGTSHGATFGTTASTRGNSHNSLGGATNACENCHSYPSIGAKHNTATHLITMNEGTWVATRVTGRTYCSSCHSNDGDFAVSGTHTFKTSVFAKEAVAGANDPVGSCTGCHGGGTAGASSANYWPDGSNANAENSPAQNKHLTHMTRLAAKRYNETIAQLLTDNANGTSDTKQKALCDYCHRASAQDATHKNSTVEVFPAGYNKTLWNVADGGTLAAYSNVNDTCSNVDCHNSKLTLDGTFGWYDAGTSTCLMCHTVGGTGANPTTGLHNTTAVSMVTGKRHDDTLKPASGCAACHGMPAITSTSSHINGTFAADSGTNNDRGLTGLYTDAAANSGTCSGGLAGAAGCHDGAGDAGSWVRKWSNTADDGGTAPCANCHGGIAGSAWTFGTNNVVGDGSVSHGRDWDAQNGAQVMANHSSANACNSCHVYPDAPYSTTWGTGNHGNDRIDMNSTFGYDQAAWNCTSACHTGVANTNRNLEDSGWTVQAVAGPGLSCTSCHGATSPAAGVGTASPHIATTRGGAFVKCENCHPGGTKGATHSNGGNASVVVILNNAAAGISYTHDVDTTAGTQNGFVLGGDATTGTTEAEICWNCHLALSPIASEWGTNTGGTYNNGSLHSTAGDATASPGNHLNWTTGYWKSGAGFTYKNGPLANRPTRTGADPGTVGGGSVHATGGTVGTQDEALANIRCSYCHDVHNTKTGSPNGAPYLRGTWKANPYKEDGAPRNGVTFNGGTSKYGNVPRGSTATTGNGGYQIDQNNANPNTTYAYATNDGLCASCHTQAALEGLAWPGHKNAVRGFTNDTTAARNIFSVASRAMQNNRTTRPYMGYQGVTAYANSDWMGGFRSSDYQATVGSLTTIPVNGRYGYQAANFQWGTQGTGLTNLDISTSGTAVNADYHSFSCSKCHNPHASRLPRLMITNCLDTQNNTWDNQFSTDPNWTATWATDATGMKQLAYTTSAQNCHRRIDANGDGDTADAGEAAGWNTATPW